MSQSLLPPRKTGLERALEGAMARIGAAPHPLDTLWTPEACPESFLPYLAWALSVDDWDPGWTEEVKRRVVATALEVHRVKGAPGAVALTLASLGLEAVRLTEWFECEGAPFTFKVKARAPGAISSSRLASIYRAIGAAKNLRSHLLDLEIVSEVTGADYVAGAVQMGGEIVLYPSIITEGSALDSFFAASASLSLISVTVRPKRRIACAVAAAFIVQIILYPGES